MLRSTLRALSLATCLTLVGAHTAAMPGSSGESASAVAAAEDIQGAGWKAFVLCATCMVGAIGLAVAGPAAIATAAAAPGSTLAAGACIAACLSM